MILTTHALVGAALGKNISNPWIIAAIALPLHFFLDHFRHGEYLNRQSSVKNNWWKVALDLLIGFSLISAYILLTHPAPSIVRNILLGTFLSMLPDLLTLLHWKMHFTFLKGIFKFHERVHPFPKGDKRYDWNFRNARNDILLAILSILLLIL
jgi:hypothetical protein